MSYLPTVVLDLRCIQDGHRHRGIGRYARNILRYAYEHSRTLPFRVEGCFYDYFGRLNCLDVSDIGPFGEEIPFGTFFEQSFLHPRIRRRYGHMLFKTICSRKTLVHFMDQTNVPYRYEGNAIVTFHDIIDAIDGPWPHDKAFRVHSLNYFGTVLKWVKYVFADSNHTRQDLIKYYTFPSERIFVRYPPVGDAFLKSLTPPQQPKKYFAYLGGFDSRKNVHRQIEAFCRFREQGFTDYQFILLGPIRSHELKALRRSFQPDPSFQFVQIRGYLPDSEVHRIMAEAVAFMQVSLYEGFGYPVIEAMARTIPVICSNTTSLKEIANGAALIVDPLNVSAIAEAMKRLALDENLRSELIHKGRERAELFCSEQPFARIFSFYHDRLRELP